MFNIKRKKKVGKWLAYQNDTTPALYYDRSDPRATLHFTKHPLLDRENTRLTSLGRTHKKIF